MDLQPLALSGNTALGVSILLGVGLGFVLVKSDFAWEQACVRFVALRSGRLLKIFLLSMVFGTIGYYFAAKSGLVRCHVMPTYFYSVLLGGVVSGVGLALSGFFPAGALSALGAGRLYAFWMILGMSLAVATEKWYGKIIDKLINSGDKLPSPALAAEAFGLTNLIWPIAAGAVFLMLIVQFALPESDEK